MYNFRNSRLGRIQPRQCPVNESWARRKSRGSASFSICRDISLKMGESIPESRAERLVPLTSR